MNFLYTIIIATYNSGDYLDSCLESVFGTLGKDDRYQIIIKDAKSSDSTLEIIKTWNEFLNINLISSKDDGIYNAWNQALTSVNSKWVSFLGSDDKFVLENINEFFETLEEENSDYILLPVIFNENGNKVFCENKMDFESAELKKRMRFAHPGVIHNTDLFLNSKFDDNLKVAGDYEFILRSLLNKEQVKFKHYSSSGAIIEFFDGGVSSNPQYLNKTIKEITYIRRKHKLKLIDKFIIRLSFKWYLYRLMGPLGLKVNDYLLSCFFKMKY